MKLNYVTCLTRIFQTLRPAQIYLMAITILRQKNANKDPQQIKCFERHRSITTIAKQCLSSSFNFQKTNANEVMKTISQLNTAKTCQNADTHTKTIKLN